MQNISNSSTSEYESYINKINGQMTYYYVMVSSALGIPGNVISMFVFIHVAVKNPKINMGFLYTCKTAIDLILLIFTLLVFIGSPYLYGYVVTNLNDSYCRGFTFLRRYLVQASSWMSVIIIFDRFTFVFYQNRFKFMKNKLVLSFIIFGVMILLAIANILNFFFYIGGTSKTSILFTCISSNDIAIASDIINMLLRSYIPLILMIFFDSQMIYRLFKLSRSSQSVQKCSLMRKEHQFTIAAISCDVFFFLCNFPLSVFNFLYDANLYTGAFVNNSTLSVLYGFYINICLNVAFLFQTCSIFMYIGFNKLFRKHLFAILFKLLPCMDSARFNFETNDAGNNNGQNGST